MTWCQKRRICLQTDLIISERWVPGFITVTKCLLFNHIIRQLSARLRQANLTSTCAGDHTELPPGCCFTNIWFQDVSGVSMGGWAPEGCTVHSLFLLLYFTYCLPSRSLVCTQVDTNGASANTHRRKKFLIALQMQGFMWNPTASWRQNPKKFVLFTNSQLAEANPTEGRQTSFRQNNSSWMGEKNLLKEFLKRFPFWWL